MKGKTLQQTKVVKYPRIPAPPAGSPLTLQQGAREALQALEDSALAGERVARNVGRMLLAARGWALAGGGDPARATASGLETVRAELETLAGCCRIIARRVRPTLGLTGEKGGANAAKN